jgi:hypothetical protein
MWTDPIYRLERSTYDLSRMFCGGAATPQVETNIGGPGSLGLFLGATGVPAPETVWYEPSIPDLEQSPALHLATGGIWWQRHETLLHEAVRRNDSRYIVGMPDLIENIDTLAQLRDPQTLLSDLVDRPAWVKEKIAEINQAFFQAYDRFYAKLRDPWGGSAFCAFSLWGPGKVAKVQCDFSCMISSEMFGEYVVPAMAEQCHWLDHSMYHLDGTQARHHLPALLEIESLDAIEWTPQAGAPGGGSAEWYGLYREIKAGGKSVQAVGVAPNEVEPLLDAVGPEGMFIMTWARNETEARDLLRRVGWTGSV